MTRPVGLVVVTPDSQSGDTGSTPVRGTRPGHTQKYPWKLRVHRLTERERVTLQWAAQGYTTAEIAEKMDTRENTVRGHLRRARRKLDARNTTHAVVIAIRTKVI